MIKPYQCNICGAKNSSLIFNSRAPLSITSDLRIWPKGVAVFQCRKCGYVFKKPDKKELTKIYRSYQLFEDKDEQDQAIFIPEKPPQSRTDLLIETLATSARLSDSGKILDIGCNKGLLLAKFAENFPGWRLFGHEISDSYEEHLKKIPKFAGFYNGELGRIKEKFNLITIVHTLEHINNPKGFLKKVRKLLLPNGLLLVQVPNYSLNPFDILVFEHVSHFSPETLEQILINAGFEVVIKSTSTVPKELTYLARVGTQSYTGELKFGIFLRSLARKNVRFLSAFERLVLQANNKHPLIIFGTAEAGTWIAGLVDNKIDFFVDESPWKIGKNHLEIQIKHPTALKKGDQVILGMAPLLAHQVYNKWKHTNARFWYLFSH